MSDTHVLPRWVLGLAASAMILFLGFVGSSIYQFSDRMARMEEQLKAASSANAQLATMNSQLAVLQARLDRLEIERRSRWRGRREGRPE